MPIVIDISREVQQLVEAGEGAHSTSGNALVRVKVCLSLSPVARGTGS